jgi:hypothetical protein
VSQPAVKVSTGPGGKGEVGHIVVPQTQYPYLWVLGQGPLSTTTPGTDSACTDGTFYAGAVFVPARTLITGATNLIGSVGGTDKVIYYLWDSTGALLAWTAVAGTTVGTTATMQTRLAFVDPVTIDGPALVYAGCIFNGTTAKFRTHAIGNGPAFSSTGTFGTNAALTVATTFTADKAPVMGLY